MSNHRLCLTTYISGTQYQRYIPILLYSLQKSYPEYRVVLFLHEPLDSEIKAMLARFSLMDNARIIENVFADCPKMTPLKACSLRWVLWDDEFSDYEYLYTIDTDMFYIRENIDLVDQHVRHMTFCKLPFSNLARLHKTRPYYPVNFLQRIKHAGARRLFDYLTHPARREKRLSGLHFVDCKKYYAIMNGVARNQERYAIYTGDFLNRIFSPDNETFLYRMLEDHGFDMSKIGFQHDSISMLSPDNPERLEFRPHHGIHLGCFRADLELLHQTNGLGGILDSVVYKEYVMQFRMKILPDAKFRELLLLQPDSIRSAFQKIGQYYGFNLN